jgi:hypothetical protein
MKLLSLSIVLSVLELVVDLDTNENEQSDPQNDDDKSSGEEDQVAEEGQNAVHKSPSVEDEVGTKAREAVLSDRLDY